jgi:high-affinity iron transporter
MLASLIIVFREVIEAGLIIGILMAATKGISGRWYYALTGVAAGTLGACIVAYFADAIASSLTGMGQEVFNASALSIAVILITWHNFWMSKHGKDMTINLKAVGTDVKDGVESLSVIAVITGVAILREGSEIVLFLYGIFSSGNETIASLMTGGLLGLCAGAIISALTYFGLVKIPARYLFGVTNILLTFLAAGMAAQAVLFLEQAGVINILTAPMWDTSSIIDDNGIVGRTLNALMGYTSQPSQMQLTVYLLIVFLNLEFPKKKPLLQQSSV